LQTEDATNIGKVLANEYRTMRAIIRDELHYTPQVLDTMTVRQIAEAYNDIIFVRQLHQQAKKSKR
jgi:hypothetical protein